MNKQNTARNPIEKLSTPLRYINNDQGVAIFMALLFLVVIAVFVPLTLNMTTTDVKRTGDYEDSRKAFYVAEAGLQRAMDDLLAGFNDTSTYSSIDDVLGAANDTTDVIENLENIAFGDGTYTVTVVDNSDGDGDQDTDVDNVVFLVSTASVDGETKTLQARITEQTSTTSGTYTGTHAVATESDLQISGNPTIQGSGGSIHTNANLTMNGNPDISQSATASGSYNTPGDPTVGAGSGGGVPTEELPDVTISDYKQYADYVMGSDGIVRDGSGNQIFDASGGDKWDTLSDCDDGSGWYFEEGPPKKWKLGDDCGAEGNYYFESSAEVGSSPGSSGNPWDVSFMAEGSIQISGNPEIANYKNGGHSAGVQNIFMLAGTDIQWNGNGSTTIEGFMYAGEQIQFNGNPNIEGFVIAKDKANTSDLVEDNIINGNPTITYTGGSMATPFAVNVDGDTELTIISWNEN